MKIKIIKQPQPGAGVEIGDIFTVRRYPLDPWSRFVLVKKVQGSESPYKKESKTHCCGDAEIIN